MHIHVDIPLKTITFIDVECDFLEAKNMNGQRFYTWLTTKGNQSAEMRKRKSDWKILKWIVTIICGAKLNIKENEKIQS